jgi:hypothetical protein
MNRANTRLQPEYMRQLRVALPRAERLALMPPRSCIKAGRHLDAQIRAHPAIEADPEHADTLHLLRLLYTEVIRRVRSELTKLIAAKQLCRSR